MATEKVVVSLTLPSTMEHVERKCFDISRNKTGLLCNKVCYKTDDDVRQCL